MQGRPGWHQILLNSDPFIATMCRGTLKNGFHMWITSIMARLLRVSPILWRGSLLFPTGLLILALHVSGKFRARAINKFSESFKNLWSDFRCWDILSTAMAWVSPYQKTFSINTQFHHACYICYSGNKFHLESCYKQQALYFERIDSLQADSKAEFTTLRIL